MALERLEQGSIEVQLQGNVESRAAPMGGNRRCGENMALTEQSLFYRDLFHLYWIPSYRPHIF
jgi:hypothetical protein